jgi:hypothetical protein
MCPSADLFFSEGGKPSFYHIEPGSACGGEVHMIARPLGQPGTDYWCFVSAVVVQDQMDIQRFRNSIVDPTQELPKLDRPMPPMALPNHLSGFHIQSGKEGRRTMPAVVMGAPLNLSGSHRENGLCAIQRLNLGLFIDAQDQGTLRRIEVQTHDVPDLLNKERIGGKLEGFGTVGLQGEGTPNATDRTLTQAGSRRHRTGAPVRRISRGRFQRHGDHSLNILITDCSRGTWPRFIQQAVKTIQDEASPPLANRLSREIKPLCHVTVRATGCTGKHDPRPTSKGLRRFRSSRPSQQGFSFFIGQLKGSKRTTHVDPPFSPIYYRNDIICQRINNSGH